MRSIMLTLAHASWQVSRTLILLRLQLLDKFVRPQYGFFDDKVGPVTLCVLIMVALTAILIMAIVDYVHG